MLGLFIKIFSCAIAFLCLAANSGYAAAGHADYGSLDLYQACNNPAVTRRATIRQDSCMP